MFFIFLPSIGLFLLLSIDRIPFEFLLIYFVNPGKTKIFDKTKLLGLTHCVQALTNFIMIKIDSKKNRYKESVTSFAEKKTI